MSKRKVTNRTRSRWEIETAVVLTTVFSALAVPMFSQELERKVPPELTRAFDTNRDLVKRLNFYTCRETIQRSSRGADGRVVARDTVQLDVGVGGKQEMYSWPGEANFSYMDLGDIVGHGLLAMGLFGGFAKDLFLADVGTVRPAGEDTIEGHRALQFTYQVPPQGKQWQIRWNGEMGEVGEDGRFWINAENYHLIRLKISAFQIPSQIQLRSLTIMLDFQSVGMTLTPMRASLDALESGGRAFHNSASFSSCHVFAADSKILDSDSATALVLNHYQLEQPVLPPRLTLRIRLNESLVAHDAVVGQLVTATLESAVEISEGLSVREGSTLRGRVKRFEKLDDPPNTYLVGLSFSELESGGTTYRLLAELKSMQRLKGIRTEISRAINGPFGIGTSPARKVGNSPERGNDYLMAPAIPGAAVFFLTDTDSVPEGLRMIWRTTKIK